MSDPRVHAGRHRPAVRAAAGSLPQQPSAFGPAAAAAAAATAAPWRQGLVDILDAVCKLDVGDSFARPVDAEALSIPDYHVFVTRPMDLGTVRQNLLGGLYGGEGEDEDAVTCDFEADVLLVFSNCRAYNGRNNDVSQAAARLHHRFVDMMKAWRRKQQQQRRPDAAAGRKKAVQLQLAPATSATAPAAAAAAAAAAGAPPEDDGILVWAVREHGQCWPAMLYRSPEGAAAAASPGAAGAAVPADYDPEAQRVAVFLDGSECRHCAVVSIDQTVGFVEGLGSDSSSGRAARSATEEEEGGGGQERCGDSDSLRRAIRGACAAAGCLALQPPSAPAACRIAQSVWVAHDASAREGARSYAGRAVRVPRSYWLGGPGECHGRVVSAVRIENEDYCGWGCSVRFSAAVRGRSEWHLPTHCVRRFAATESPLIPTALRSGGAGGVGEVGARDEGGSERVQLWALGNHLSTLKCQTGRLRKNMVCAVCAKPTLYMCEHEDCKVFLCNIGGDSECALRYHTELGGAAACCQ